MKSSAVTGTPSDQTAFGLITYWMINGEVEVASTLKSRSVLTCGTSFGLMTYALGSTLTKSAGVVDAAPAGVSGLKPDQGPPR